MKIAGIFVIIQAVVIFLLFPPLKTDAKPFASPASLSGNFYYEMHQDSLMDKNFKDVFGPIPLSGTPTNAVTIPLAGNYTAGTPAASPPIPLTVKYVFQVWLDAAQTLNLTVANNSSADFSSVQVTLGALGSGTISNLAHNASGVAQFNVGGKEIDSVVNVSVTLTPSSSGTFGATDNISASFSMNGLKATKVVVLDSLLKDFSKTFTCEYNLTDTIDADYIDIDKGFFIYGVTNYSNTDMLLSVKHRHLWRSDFCEGKNPPLTRINDLVGFSHDDSVSASNCDIAVREQFPASQTNTYSKHNILANRLFAEWNPAKKKAVSKVDYMLNIGAYGRHVTLSANDSLLFNIKSTSFKYKQLAGTVTEAFRRSGDTVKSAVPSSWNSASNSKYFFMTVKIPGSASIDSLQVVHNFFNPKAPDSNCTITSNMSHVVNNSFVRNQVDFSKIIIQKPDSVYFTESITIPAGSHIRLINDLLNPLDPDYYKYIGRMKIHDSVSNSTPSAPDAPATIYPFSGQVFSGPAMPQPGVKLTWHSVSFVDSYRVQVSTTSDFTSMVKDTAGISDTIFMFTGLADNTKYYWCVIAANAGGTSGWSVTASFTIALATLPDSVILVTADTARSTSDGTLLIWRTATLATTNYMLQIATDSAMEHVLVQDSTIHDTMYYALSLTPDQTYWWRAKAKTVLGWGPFSKTGKFICVLAGVVTGRTQPGRFECNGSSGTLRYTLPAQCRVSVKYYDTKGRLIYSFVNKNQGPGRFSQPDPVYTLAHGAYLRVFEAGTFVRKETVIILR